ncbi:MAG: hypothetical protein OXR84_13300 [Magnetovibrio sp.]|nr:hypothetical protein [Magnetovibrio sp.]
MKGLSRGIIWGALAWAFAQPAFAAGPLDDEFNRLEREILLGVGGYTGAVRPVSGDVKLAYGPTPPESRRIVTYVSTRGATAKIEIETELVRQATATGLLMNAMTLRRFSIGHQISADGVTIGSEALPQGTTVVMVSDERGATRDAAILPPAGAPAAAVPQPGTHAFAKAVNQFPVPVLAAETAVQDSDVFLPVTLPLGGAPGIKLVRGVGPRLRGEVDCPRPRCLLVEVDEETQFSAGGQEIRGIAKGHMIIAVAPVSLIRSTLQLITIVNRPGQREEIRSILINEPAD